MKKTFIVVLSLILLASFVSAVNVDIEIQDTGSKEYNCNYTEPNYIRAWLTHDCLAGKSVSLDLNPGWYYLSVQADDGTGVSNQGVAAKILINGEEITSSASWKNCYNDLYDYKCVDPYDNLSNAFLYPGNPVLIPGADTIWSGENANFILVSYKFEVKAEIACSTNSECDDNNAYTQDICINAGTADSYCQHNNLQCIQNSDCSSFNLASISNCNNNPDNNPLTWDYFGGFNSVCQSNACTIGSVSLSHSFEIGECGVECVKNSDCSSNEECKNHVCKKESNNKENNVKIIDEEPVSSAGQEKPIIGTTEDSIVLAKQGKVSSISNFWLWLLLILVIVLVIIIIIAVAMR